MKKIKAWAVLYWGMDKSCMHNGEIRLFVTENDARDAASCNPKAHEVAEIAMERLDLPAKKKLKHPKA